MHMYDVIIIGGGAAGLFASANLTTTNALLLDHSQEVGKKLLITGGGMCNLTNTLPVEAFLSQFGNKQQRNFLLPALQNLPTDSVYEWFEQRGLRLLVREDGKVFPQSLDAHDVRDFLVRHSKAPIVTGVQIAAITKQDVGFLIKTTSATYETKNIILATGGMSYPRTGCDGSGYELAKALGHSIVPPKPALVAVSIEAYPFKHLAGNSVRNAWVSFYHNTENTAYDQRQKDVLFTHDGLSGPAILSASRLIAKQDRIKLSLITAENHSEAEQAVLRALNAPKKLIANALKETGMVSSLAQTLVEMAGIDKETTTATLDKTRRKALVQLASAMEMTVSSTKGFQSAMVTSGGVDLAQVNRKTMESNLTEGLFFCGEVLDYDGESGGFNIQAAFSTAYLAVKHLHD